MNLLNKYRLKILQKQAGTVQRKIANISPEKVLKVGIIWHEKDVRAYSFMVDYFRNKPAIIRNLCYSNAKISTDSNIVTKKDTDWLGFPKGGIVETFTETEFELLLNITVDPCFPLEVVTAMSKASFKIGWDYRKAGFYDLSVNVSQQPGAQYLVEQIIFFMEQLNKK